MKPLIKFCLILCAVLTVLGFAGVGTGIAMGIRPSQLINLARYSDSFDSHTFYDTSNIQDFDHMSENSSTKSSEYYEFYDIRHLNFYFSLCNLKIRSHDKDYVSLEAANSGTTFRCSQEGNELILEDRRKKRPFHNNMDSALHLTLYLPSQELEKADIEIEVGNITIDWLSAGSVELKSGVGELNGTDLTAENIDIILGVGDLSLENVTSSQDCSIECGTGNLTVGHYKGADLKLDCGVGDITVTAAGKRQDYNYKLDCGLGDIHLNRQLQDPDSRQHSGYEPGCFINVDNQADQELDIQCGLGNLKLNFAEEV